MTVCTPWTTAADAKTCAAVDDALLTRKILTASELLNERTGGYFGICANTVRPCTRSLATDPATAEITTRSTATTIAISAGCGCTTPRTCGCNRLSEITLGGFPIVAVTQVLVDGQALDGEGADRQYRVDDGRYLVRLPDPDGDRPGWPCCQELDLPATEPGTFQVTFTAGRAPNQAAIDAAGALACELALACTGNGEACQLPDNVRSQVRQGVGTEYITLLDFLREGATGIREVDYFLDTWDPAKRKARLGGQIVSPDIHLPVRRTS